jgi:anti-sigma-K factor RskA
MQAATHQPYEDELAAYLLDALTDEERQAFQAHLQSCEMCQARERWLRTSVEVLPASVEQLEPPPELRERLLDTVRGEAHAPVAARRTSWRERFAARALRPAVGFAALLIVAGAIAGYAIRGGGGGSSTTTVTAQAAAAEPSARGTIVRSGDRAIVRVSGLPQRTGRVYEVWLLKDGKPVPSALFQVRRDGSGSAGIPAGVEGATQIMVTSEPAGGSDQPTTKPVLSAPV